VAGVAFFVGGQLVLAVAVVPALRGAEAPMRAAARRFGVASLVALVVLVITGAAMADRFDLWRDEVLHAKLALLVLVGVLTALHVASPRSRAVSIALLASSLGVVWLGVVLTH
jgi:uncharacterized membrane protein